MSNVIKIRTRKAARVWKISEKDLQAIVKKKKLRSYSSILLAAKDLRGGGGEELDPMKLNKEPLAKYLLQHDLIEGELQEILDNNTKKQLQKFLEDPKADTGANEEE